MVILERVNLILRAVLTALLLSGCSLDVSIYSLLNDNVAMTSAIQGRANINSWPITVTFNTAPNAEPTVNDFELENGTILSMIQVSPLVYQLVVEPDNDGLVKVSLPGKFVSSQASLSIIVDRQKPTAVLSKVFAAYTHQKTASIYLEASEPIVGVTASHFQVTNGHVVGISGSGKSYVLQIEAQNEGQVSVQAMADKFKDEADNLNIASNTLSWFYDLSPPTVGMSLVGNSPTAISPILVDLVSTEPLLNFTAADLIATNGNVGTLTQIDSTHWQVELIPLSSGDVTLTLGANKFTDLAGRANQSSTAITAEFSSTRPTVTLSTIGSYFATGTASVTATFSEDVTGFSASDLALTNATASISGGPKVYTILLTPTAEGLVSIKVQDSAAINSVSSPSQASNTVTTYYDLATPTLTISSPGGATQTSAPLTLDFNFSEAITGFTSSDISVTNGSASNFTKVSDTHWTADITPSTIGTVQATVATGAYQDLAGRTTGSSSSYSIYFDNIAPTVSLSSLPTTSVVNPIQVTATFSEIVTGFDTSDLDLVNATAVITGAGASYTINLTALADGPVSVLVKNSAAIDVAGNPSTASNQVSTNYQPDNIAPTVTLSSLAAYTKTATTTVTATFSEAVSGFSTSSLNLVNATATISGTGPTYTITLTPIAQGAFSVQIIASSVTDGNSNPNTASNTSSSTFDTVAPTAIIAADAGYYNFDSPINLSVNFSESVTGLTTSDFTAVGGTVAVSGSGSIYAIVFTPTGGSGVKSLKLKSASVTDVAGNANTADSNTEEFYFDNTPVTISVNEHEQSAIENDSTSKLFTLQMSAAKPYDVDVYYRLQGTGIEGTEHNLATNSYVRIPAGQTSVTKSFNLIANTSSTANKYFQLNLYYANTPAATFTRDYQSRFFIYDSDVAKPTPTAVSLGNQTRCLINSNKKLKCWGDNSSGQLGDGTTTTSDQPIDIDSGTDYLKISVGRTHVCGITTTAGTVKCWGNNSYSKLGNGNTTNSSTPLTIATGFSDIYAGGEITCGLKSGDVYCWGNNTTSGAMGKGTITGTVTTPGLSFNGTYDFIDLAVGETYVCAVDTNKDLYCWGYNANGQLGDNSTTTRPSPVLIGNGYVKVRTQNTNYTANSTCAIKDTGDLYCWGTNSSGQLGDNTTTNRLVPTLVSGGNLFSDVAVGTLHTCGLLTSGGVKCWGANTYNWNPIGGVGNGAVSGITNSSPQTVIDTDTYTQISASWNATCGITVSNKVKCWGELNRGFLGDPSTNIRLTPAVSDLGELYQSVTSSGGGNCGITMAGILKCWGGDVLTPFPGGDGTTIMRTSPVVIDRGRIYKSISSGANQRCGIRDDDSLYCWGSNAYGQVGVGGTTVSLPMKVDSGVKYLQVSAGSLYTCGITTGNILKCWGDNTNYKLGDNTNTTRFTPVIIDSGTLYKKVDTGAGSWTGGCAITMDDHLKCWGYNYYGVVGDGTTTTRQAPVPIMTSTKFIDVSVGGDFACAITDAKAMYCWGTGSDNRLGTGNTTQQNSPVLIASGTQFDTVAAGSTAGCAIRTADKRVMCWGTNGPFGVLTGVLGNNNTAATTPTLTADTDAYTSITSPGNAACGVTVNNVLKCWGHNRYGGLANDSVFRMWGTPTDITPWINP